MVFLDKAPILRKLYAVGAWPFLKDEFSAGDYGTSAFSRITLDAKRHELI